MWPDGDVLSFDVRHLTLVLPMPPSILPSLTWACLSIHDLSAATLLDIMQLRNDAFLVELQLKYLDYDGYDKPSLHVLATTTENTESRIAAYARIIPPLTVDATQIRPLIGRVVVAPHARGAGLARALMLQAIEVCSARWPHQGIDLCAKFDLEKFYTSLGFETTSSEPYDIYGAAQIDMHRP
ncbi:Aste57867_3564 [Aphanomyces stellatus]|uniref:Aste57867_3564 protein n=1 Tax=Aphanomyces stellatus TaxID=120398 RepID=A0A485KBP0_9STRA|nr:hypothetical protein As57867_003553 [Aphanomyces stellatus]VFT80727.1 Aste57867_3564 [Aphanomyces stellatus]